MKGNMKSEFLSSIAKRGLNQQSWALDKAFNPSAVSRVLSGKSSARLEDSEPWNIKKEILKEIGE